ncbi:hypothetical protein NPIL_280351 [Nephila pilipes]|uniref:MADF domain-containing protein n=1 Tax=Nephila pilipes TaxID=299642 RepID=A0A8X6MRA9_NEPPI|nr:hypothetical protein NPIL_280351 [Nephila pilipes]
MNSETLIALVHSKPEIWDQSYSSKNLKVQTWMYIADKLGVTTEVAKARWTNLRDLFRRELKKSLRILEQTGDPNAHKPRWKHFKSLLFLKDQMVKDESANSFQFDESCSLYPQTILGKVSNIC